MNYRRMGQTGLKISELSLGAWITFGGQVDETASRACMREAYENGVNHFDNADIYSMGNAEIVMGKALKDIPRSDLVISSKVFWPTGKGPNDRGLSRKHIMESAEKSLKRLGTDYLDLYYCHRFDPEVPYEEIVRTMDDLVHQGKVLYWGTSEWRGWQVAEATAVARQWGFYPPQVEQPQYNLLVWEKVENELVPLSHTLGFGLVTWSPLASGYLSGKYLHHKPSAESNRSGFLENYINPATQNMVGQLAEMAGELGCTTSQLALAWALRLPEISSVITGASRVEQVRENLKAAELNLSAEVLTRIDNIFRPAQ
jgi:voltage-dependent potassium channel beta subunit